MTAILKNIYLDRLDNIVNKHDNTVHGTIKMKPTDVTCNSYTEYKEKLNKKILNLKLVFMLEFQNTKTFLLRDTLQIGQNNFWLLVKLKIHFRGLMQFATWIVKKLLEVFTKKNWKNTSQEKFRIVKEKKNCEKMD